MFVVSPFTGGTVPTNLIKKRKINVCMTISSHRDAYFAVPYLV